MEQGKRSAFKSFLTFFGENIKNFFDYRSLNNKQYSMYDVVMSAYSCFHVQSQSFLSHQKFMENTNGKNNARSLFGINNIPCDNQIRNIIDKQPPSVLDNVYRESFNWLQDNGKLKPFIGINDTLLMALDGTEFFSSYKIECENCLTKTSSKNGTTRSYHSALTPAIVAINNPNVIPFSPEFITPQDGHDKQDCENAAAKRWLDTNSDFFKDHKITILGDDLYSRQPVCETVLEKGFNFIFVCKYPSHKYLKEWITIADDKIDLNKSVERVWTGKRTLHYTYRFANNVPLKDGKDAMPVNWAELVITDDAGKIVNTFAFVTNHQIDENNVKAIIESGRCRWKIENENNNTLKTKGYNIEHNFGHGNEHLANTLLSMNILAFLCHTMMDISDKRYILLRKSLPTRRKFFTDIEALTTYMYFGNWDQLLKFMINGLELKDPGG